MTLFKSIALVNPSIIQKNQEETPGIFANVATIIILHIIIDSSG
jgi:hypothetical protein